jgi:short-subunit dehydrogenase
MELNGTVAILTGASRGIGIHLAEHLARRGVHLALAARSAEDLEITAKKVQRHGVRAIAIPTDVTKRAELENLVHQASERLGPIDILVNNAGVEAVGYFEKLDLDYIERAVTTNLTSLILLTRMVVPQMLERGHGHIANIASVAGKVARPYAGVYAATKHGVVGFSWSLRAELGPKGVGVSVICPGYVTGDGMFAQRESHAGKPPRGIKYVTPAEVAEKTLKAIEANQAEVIVGPATFKVADVVHALSPDLAIGISRRSGVYDFVKREATGD